MAGISWLPTYQAGLLTGTCSVCFQPECFQSAGGKRPPPGSHAARLAPGERQYRGYGDWIVHPEEATFVLHRGYALVNGERQRVTFSHNEAYVTQITVAGTFATARDAAFVDCSLVQAA